MQYRIKQEHLDSSVRLVRFNRFVQLRFAEEWMYKELRALYPEYFEEVKPTAENDLPE